MWGLLNAGDGSVCGRLGNSGSGRGRLGVPRGGTPSLPAYRSTKKMPPNRAAFDRYLKIVQSKTGVSTPRILCSFGDVVVYCMWIFLSGKMYGAAPKAASAASWKPDRISFFLPG